MTCIQRITMYAICCAGMHLNAFQCLALLFVCRGSTAGLVWDGNMSTGHTNYD